MTSVDIFTVSQGGWRDVCSKVKRSIVFMDSSSAESLHWNGGAMLLIQAGAFNVKEFSSFECGDQNQKKAVFIISGPLSGLNIDILRDIIKASHFEYTIVISSIPPSMHTLVELGPTEEEKAAFFQLEEQLLEWMGNMNYTTEVLYMPLSCAPVTPHLYIVPEHSKTFPLLPTDVEQLKKFHKKDYGQVLADVEFINLPKESQLQMKLLVCALNTFMEQLGVSEDCYALGTTSKIVATELASLTWAKTRRKSAKNKASLLLVDRTLDLAGAIGHHSEAMLDRILETLPRLPGHHNDVEINMVQVCNVPSDAKNVIVPGCLSHCKDAVSKQLLEKLATKKQKECLIEVNRQLVEAAAGAGLPIKHGARVSAKQLQATINLFKGKAALIEKNLGLLQIAQGVVDALLDPSINNQDSLLGIEKGLLQCIAEEEELSPMTQITDTLKKNMAMSPEKRPHSLDDIFGLLLYIYSLYESNNRIDPKEEKILQEALENAILDEKLEDLPPFLQELIDGHKTPEKVSKIVDEIFEKLQGFSDCSLSMFRHMYGMDDMMGMPQIKPLLKQVTNAIFDPQKPELPDIIYKSTGFRDLLKSGFGYFMNVSKPRPNDHPLLVIFVIGGITCQEVKQIKEAITASKSAIQVLIGSTSLLKPEDLLHKIFVQNNLYPSSILL